MNFFDGWRCLADGFGLVRSAGARLWIMLPAGVSLVIVGGGIGFIISQSGRVAGWLADLLPNWLDFLGALLSGLLNVIAIITGLWLFGFVAMILSSPLHGVLSARFDVHLGARAELADLHIGQALASALRREWRKLRYQLPRMLLVVGLSFVPLVNVLAPVAGVLMTAWLMAIQFVDLPGENRDLPFEQTLQRLRGNRGAALGFGTGVALLLSIPVVNVMVIPLAIAGGTLLWHRLGRNGQNAAGSSPALP